MFLLCLWDFSACLQLMQASRVCSLNSEEGLGVASLSVIYGALILSSVLLPPIIIKNLGSKWTIVASMGCYVTYFLGNLYPGWATLIPTSVILGLGGAPLWSAKCTYLTISANQEAEENGKRARDLVNLYFGIFFLLFQSSAVWGNLMSALIFGQDPGIAEITEEDLWFCGATDSCEYPGSAVGNTTRPAQNLVNTLLGCYVGFGVLAMVLVAVLLDNIDGDVARTYRENREPLGSAVQGTFRHLKDKRQLLLIPLTIYSGLEQAFLSGDYNKYYVTCTMGIYFVGYSMICFGATNALCSLAFGKMAQYTGRFALFTFAAGMNCACIIALLCWKPHPDQLPVFFVFPAIWAMADAVWQTQINALYGVIFPDQRPAAFSNYRMWESTGFLIAFAYSNFLCVNVKLYILIGALLVSFGLYGWVEYEEQKNSTVWAQNINANFEEDMEDRELTA
ncbi:protein unc-93 homolog A-like isoform X2 [Anguilla anguilla]|uniref:protein unc-93 homolog A-like isoform X2 n=1 Tax=Anguilla anguilla TaxID=7936 RepID=UPI0015AA666D|nr:protein unc-93 homolog A-like isoform X2 [Anguilla anguilla]